MTGKIKLAISLLTGLLLLANIFFIQNPVDTTSLQSVKSQTAAVHPFDVVKNETTLSGPRPLDQINFSPDLPNRGLMRDWTNGCGKQDYKKELFTVLCGNGWGGEPYFRN